MQLDAFFTTRYRPARLPGEHRNTVRLYESLFRTMAVYLGRQPEVADLIEPTLLGFLDWYASQPIQRRTRTPHRPSSESVNKLRDQLNALSNYAFKKRLLDEVPDIPVWPDTTEPIPPVVLTPKQALALLTECRKLRGNHGGVPASAFWVAFTCLLWDTGARPGALFALPWSRVDLDGQTIALVAATQKQRRTQRLRVSAETEAALRRIIQPYRELVFPWNLSPDSRYNRMKQMMRRAGIPRPPGRVFRVFRQTVATYCHANGVDATRQLGHSSDAVTRRHYLADVGPQAADIMPRPGDSSQLTMF